MKTKFLFTALSLLLLLAFTNCSKDELAENQKQIKKSWRLTQYLIDGNDQTSSLRVSNYSETYTDNGKYDRTFNDKNGNRQTQNGTFEFETAQRLKISGVGSIEFTENNTATSSYYDILKLNDTELWYSYTNGAQSTSSG